MFKRVGEESELIECPYEKSHQIIRHRFQVHLGRCRRNYPDAEKVTCPFNITHILNKVELNWHVTVCMDRQSFEIFKHRDAPIPGLSSSHDTTYSGSISERTTMMESIEWEEATENWDAEPPAEAYKPDEYLEKAHILRNPVGMTPSQRKIFREAERKRLKSLNYF